MLRMVTKTLIGVVREGGEQRSKACSEVFLFAHPLYRIDLTARAQRLGTTCVRDPETQAIPGDWIGPFEFSSRGNGDLRQYS